MKINYDPLALRHIPVRLINGGTGKELTFEAETELGKITTRIGYYFSGVALALYHLAHGKCREQMLEALVEVSKVPSTFNAYISDVSVLDFLIALTRTMVSKSRTNEPWTLKLKELWAILGESQPMASILLSSIPDLPKAVLSIISGDQMHHSDSYPCLYPLIKLGIDSPPISKELLHELIKLLESAFTPPTHSGSSESKENKRLQRYQNSIDATAVSLSNILKFFYLKQADSVAKESKLLALIAETLKLPEPRLQLIDAALNILRWFGISHADTISSSGVFELLKRNLESPLYVSRFKDIEFVLNAFGFDTSDRKVIRSLMALQTVLPPDITAHYISIVQEALSNNIQMDESDMRYSIPALISIMKINDSPVIPPFFVHLCRESSLMNSLLLFELGYVDALLDAIVSHQTQILHTAPAFYDFFLAPIRQHSDPKHRETHTAASYTILKHSALWEQVTTPIQELVSLSIRPSPRINWTLVGDSLLTFVRMVLEILAQGPAEALESARKVGFFSRALVPLFAQWHFPNLSDLDNLEHFVQYSFVMDRLFRRLETRATKTTDEDGKIDSVASLESLRDSFRSQFASKYTQITIGEALWVKGSRKDCHALKLRHLFPTSDSWVDLCLRYYQPNNGAILTCVRIACFLYGTSTSESGAELVAKTLLPNLPSFHPGLANLSKLPFQNFKPQRDPEEESSFGTNAPFGATTYEDFGLPSTSDFFELCTKTKYLEYFEYACRTIAASRRSNSVTVLERGICAWLWWHLELSLRILKDQSSLDMSNKDYIRALTQFESRTRASLRPWAIANYRLQIAAASDYSDPRLRQFWPNILYMLESRDNPYDIEKISSKFTLLKSVFEERIMGSLHVRKLLLANLPVTNLLEKRISFSSAQGDVVKWYQTAIETFILASDPPDMTEPSRVFCDYITKEASEIGSIASNTAKATPRAEKAERLAQDRRNSLVMLLHHLALLLLNAQLSQVAMNLQEPLECDLVRFQIDIELRYYVSLWLVHFFQQMNVSALMLMEFETLAILGESSMILSMEPQKSISYAGHQLHAQLRSMTNFVPSDAPKLFGGSVWQTPHLWMMLAEDPWRFEPQLSLYLSQSRDKERNNVIAILSYIVIEYAHQLRLASENETRWRTSLDEATTQTYESSRLRKVEIPAKNEAEMRNWLKLRCDKMVMSYRRDFYWPQLLKEQVVHSELADGLQLVAFPGELILPYHYFVTKPSLDSQKIVKRLLVGILLCLQTQPDFSSIRPVQHPEIGFIVLGKQVDANFGPNTRSGLRNSASLHSLSTSSLPEATDGPPQRSKSPVNGKKTKAEYFVVKPPCMERDALKLSAVHLHPAKVYRPFEALAISTYFASNDSRFLEYLSVVLPQLPQRFVDDPKRDQMIVSIVCALLNSGHSIALTNISGIVLNLKRFLSQFDMCQSVADAKKVCEKYPPYVATHIDRLLCSIAPLISLLSGEKLSPFYDRLLEEVGQKAVRELADPSSSYHPKVFLESLFSLVRFEWPRFEAQTLPLLASMALAAASNPSKREILPETPGANQSPLRDDYASRMAAFLSLYHPGEIIAQNAKENDKNAKGKFYRAPIFPPHCISVSSHTASHWSHLKTENGDLNASPPLESSKEDDPKTPSIGLNATWVRDIVPLCLQSDSNGINIKPASFFPAYFTEQMFANLRGLFVEKSNSSASPDPLWHNSAASPEANGDSILYHIILFLYPHSSLDARKSSVTNPLLHFPRNAVFRWVLYFQVKI